ncbi:DUF397 domain-containing protein [Streptomyces sp. P01-B04]|uniref:DUF397 domain-containing protein n=1 Tax=Streptomyces poriferorum TaxID=2798799 RepID=UPI001C5DF5A3|nr:DUF397 domain-containing protein [Streptomyces poriferorum]MBW5247574.1 DUF397 domain-containing protein [Streptomyces poriferorum]MBW5257502.1 DUF397 domain-containing protein [Streptomyces poriferorum]
MSSSARTVFPGHPGGTRSSTAHRSANASTSGSPCPLSDPGSGATTSPARRPAFAPGAGGSSGDDCVEVATCPTTVHLHDSKVEEGPQLALSPTTWTQFVAYAVQG